MQGKARSRRAFELPRSYLGAHLRERRRLRRRLFRARRLRSFAFGLGHLRARFVPVGPQQVRVVGCHARGARSSSGSRAVVFGVGGCAAEALGPEAGVVRRPEAAHLFRERGGRLGCRQRPLAAARLQSAVGCVGVLLRREERFSQPSCFAFDLFFLHPPANDCNTVVRKGTHA